MRWFHDAEIDIASFYLVDHIAEGEIEQDQDDVADSEVMEIGPQLTPTGDKLLLGYDASDHLVYLEVNGCSRVLRDETLAAAE